MKYVIFGVNSINKGAELMLYAILQEIERVDPSAKVFITPSPTAIDGLQSNLCVKFPPANALRLLLRRLHITGALARLHIPHDYIEEYYPVKDADFFFDANGFWVTDKWNITKQSVTQIEKQLKGYSKQHTKIVYLPQAFGPIEYENTKRMVAAINKYADLIFPRDERSKEYLEGAGVLKNKTCVCHDFTSLVNGVFPENYEHLKGGVCIIPNKRMIDKKAAVEKQYFQLIEEVVNVAKDRNLQVYLLNHEGVEDESLAQRISHEITTPIEVVSGLNALEVKGLIASAYICVSSRFHGVISALNSCVPCLATSWSHKYAELYKDYNLDGFVINVNDISLAIQRVKWILDSQVNDELRQNLMKCVPEIKSNTQRMWKQIWNLK